MRLEKRVSTELCNPLKVYLNILEAIRGRSQSDGRAKAGVPAPASLRVEVEAGGCKAEAQGVAVATASASLEVGALVSLDVVTLALLEGSLRVRVLGHRPRYHLLDNLNVFDGLDLLGGFDVHTRCS